MNIKNAIKTQEIDKELVIHFTGILSLNHKPRFAFVKFMQFKKKKSSTGVSGFQYSSYTNTSKLMT